jgi:hypothetical protein
VNQVHFESKTGTPKIVEKRSYYLRISYIACMLAYGGPK